MPDPAPYTDPSYGGDMSFGANADSGEKYPRLRGLVTWFKIYAYCCFGAAVILPVFLFGSAKNGMEETMAMTSAPVILVACVAQGFFFLMVAEIPQVFMDTEKNTREATELLRTVATKKP